MSMMHFCDIYDSKDTHRKISNISRTEYHNLDFSRIDLRLSLRNILEPGVRLRMKM